MKKRNYGDTFIALPVKTESGRYWFEVDQNTLKVGDRIIVTESLQLIAIEKPSTFKSVVRNIFFQLKLLIAS